MKIPRAFDVSLLLFLMGILTGCGFEFNRTFGEDTSSDAGEGHEAPDTGDERGASDTQITTSDSGTGAPEAETGIADTEEGIEIASGALVHRWRFDGDLADEVDGSDAVIVEPDGASGGDATLSESEITLAGGGADEASYISLGSHLLTGIGGPATIELFATLLGVAYFPRIFEFGSDRYEYLNMTWTVETDGDRDAVIWWGGEEMTPVWDTNAPYRIGEEYHIVMTIAPGEGEDGALRIAWYSAAAAAADMGEARGLLDTTDPLAELDDADCWLGKSHSDADAVANASYNDVRIWSGALSMKDIETLHDLGTTGTDVRSSFLDNSRRSP